MEPPVRISALRLFARQGMAARSGQFLDALEQTTGLGGRAKEGVMELFIFVRFHAREGEENAVEEALREVLAPSREESGCVSFRCFGRCGTGDCFTFIR